MTQPAETRRVNISQAGFAQRSWQGSLVELRIVPGARHRAYIHDASGPMCLNQANEFVERVRSVANGQDQRRRLFLWHAFSKHSPSARSFFRPTSVRLAEDAQMSRVNSMQKVSPPPFRRLPKRVATPRLRGKYPDKRGIRN